jgi:hypothetical protein
MTYSCFIFNRLCIYRDRDRRQQKTAVCVLLFFLTVFYFCLFATYLLRPWGSLSNDFVWKNIIYYFFFVSFQWTNIFDRLNMQIFLLRLNFKVRLFDWILIGKFYVWFGFLRDLFSLFLGNFACEFGSLELGFVWDFRGLLDNAVLF